MSARSARRQPIRTTGLWLILIASVGCTSARLAPSSVTPGSLPDPLAAGWNGAKVCDQLEDGSTIRVLRCSFPPGVGHERHFHAAHFGYALSGGRVRISDARGVREVDITTGSSYSSPGVDWHEILNIGETTVVYLIVEPKSR